MFRVRGLGLGLCGLGFRVWALRFGAYGLGSYSLGFCSWVRGFRVLRSG